MKRLATALGLGIGLLLLAGPVAAQYRYTDDIGVVPVGKQERSMFTWRSR